MLNKEQKSVITLSAIGGLLEFYDFTIYGFFAVYFSAQFFPMTDRLAAVIATYSVFLLGYIARPLGGIIFSHIGDEFGRKNVLVITMVLMGVASLGLGLLPTYEKIGFWAPVLMATLRLLQGLAIGGELPSTIVYATESIPERPGLAMGGVFAGTLFGLVPGMLINIVIMHFLTVEQIDDFGWRIPFVLGGLLCFVAYQVRRKLHETNAFTQLRQHNKFPLLELLRHHCGKLMIGVGLIAIAATPIMLVLIFMPTYLIKILNFPPAQVSYAVLLAAVLCVSSIYVTGILADKISPIKLMRMGLFGIILSAAFCYFELYQGGNLSLAIVLFAIFNGILVVLPVILLSQLFPIEIRLTGVALAYNIAFVLFGGLTPIILTSWIAHAHMPYLAPFLWLLFAAMVGAGALFAFSKWHSH